MVKTCIVCTLNFPTSYREWYDNLVPSVCSGKCYRAWLENIASEHVPVLEDLFPTTLVDKSRRSAYEQRFEEWLIRHRMSYAYEPHRIFLAKRIYVPDFLINIGTYVEVKGLWNPGDKTKIKDFLKTGRHIHIVDGEFLRRVTHEEKGRGGQKCSV